MQQKYTLPQTIIERIYELKRIVNDSYKDVRYKIIAQALILASGEAKKKFNDEYLFQQNKEIHTQEMAGLSLILEEIINRSKISGAIKHPTEELEDRINALQLPSEDSKLPKGNIYVLTLLILLKMKDRSEAYKKIGETIEKILFSDYSLSFYKPFRNKLNQIPKDDNIQKKEELIKKQLLIEEKLIRENGLRKLL